MSVVLKLLNNDMRELEFLKYLGAIKKPANRTIPLLDIIKLNTGLSAIALPWKSPLNEVLDFHEHPDDLCAQFVQGVAFLHEHKVAHCDLNPKNVVVDTQHQQLFIIDFDLAEFVEARRRWSRDGVGHLHGSPPRSAQKTVHNRGTAPPWPIGGPAAGW